LKERGEETTCLTGFHMDLAREDPSINVMIFEDFFEDLCNDPL
jgi:hypothetical protein